MKKFLTVLLALTMSIVACFSLTACGEDPTKIGAQTGTTGAIYASYIKGTEVKEYNNPGLAVDDMLLGRIDYVIVDRATANALVADKGGKVKVIVQTKGKQSRGNIRETETNEAQRKC